MYTKLDIHYLIIEGIIYHGLIDDSAMRNPYQEILPGPSSRQRMPWMLNDKNSRWLIPGLTRSWRSWTNMFDHKSGRADYPWTDLSHYEPDFVACPRGRTGMQRTGLVSDAARKWDVCIIPGYCMKSAIMIVTSHERHGASNNRQPLFSNNLMKLTTKKLWKVRIIGPLWKETTMTGEFPLQRASSAESVSMSWRLHDAQNIR